MSSEVAEAAAGFSASFDADRDGHARVVLRGELDIATAPTVAAKLAQGCADKPAELVVDLTEVTYCDSSGIREFIRAFHLCASNSTTLRIVGASRNVRRVFEITGLTDVFSFEPV